MENLFKFLIFSIFVLFVESKYELIFDRIEHANEILDLGEIHSLRIRKFNRSTSVFNGVFEVKQVMDDDIIMSFESFNMAGGQYKKLFGRTIGGWCSSVYEPHIEKDFRSYMEHTNLTIKYGDCPFPAGWVNIKDWTPEGVGDYLPPYLPGNERWKVILWFTRNGVSLGGVTFYLIIRDNEKLFESTFG